MEFTEHDDHADIRSAIRQVCAGFPDGYWSDLDQRHEFPWEFYERLACAGWIGIAIPEEYGGGGRGITEASIMLEEIAASGAAMNGCSAVHLSIFGMEPVRKYGSPELAGSSKARQSMTRNDISAAENDPSASAVSAASE